MNTNVLSIVGGGAIGFSLAATLQSEGNRVVVYRATSPDDATGQQEITVKLADGSTLRQRIETRGLSPETALAGTVLVTAKAIGNPRIADSLMFSRKSIDVVLLQNGLGVEAPFLGKSFRSISRCVVYITAEKTDPGIYTARMVKPSPVGRIEQTGVPGSGLEDLFHSKILGFYQEAEIQREIWKKGIINTVFNSVCPLLEVDNGVFTRDASLFALARELVSECVPVANQVGIPLTVEEVLEQIGSISKRSEGQRISTLQDINAKRETEIRFFNRSICEIASRLNPPLSLPRTEVMGLLVEKKAELGRAEISVGA